MFFSKNGMSLAIFLVCSFLACFPSSAKKIPLRFEHVIVDEGLRGPDDVAPADLDGDGDVDLVVAEDDGIAWYQNSGGQRPNWRRIAPVVHEPATEWMGLWTGDFDGDGDTDLCGAAGGRGYWIENADGQGTQWVLHRLPFDGDTADHSRVHDFNGDGRDDIVMQRYHGSGVFYMPSPEDPTGEWPRFKIGEGRAGLSLHDVDSDGDMDVLVENTWLENPGDPTRENWAVHAVPHSVPRVKNAVGDLNGDGTSDFAHAEEEGDECYVVLSPDWRRVTLKSDGRGLHTMKLNDFDRDGDLDLLTADIHGGHAYVFVNSDGRGTTWEHIDLPTWSKQGSHNLWTADLNGDGWTDIVGKHYSVGSALEVWYNMPHQ